MIWETWIALLKYKTTATTRAALPRAANHYALGVIYHAQTDCIMLLHPWGNHYPQKCQSKTQIAIFMPVRECQRGGKESVSTQHLLVVVPQPTGFHILKRRANCSAWFIFPCLIPHFLPRHFLEKMQLPIFSSFVAVIPKWTADKKGVLGHQ